MDNFDILDRTIKEKVDKIIGNYLSAKDTQISNLEKEIEVLKVEIDILKQGGNL